MSYKIVGSKTIKDLVLLVNEHLEQGYVPIGGFQQIDGILAQTLYSSEKTKQQKDDIVLYNKLKNKRMELANGIGAPAYVVATNRMLESLVSIKPKHKEELREIYGFSQQKIDMYGDVFLDIINQ